MIITRGAHAGRAHCVTPAEPVGGRKDLAAATVRHFAGATIRAMQAKAVAALAFGLGVCAAGSAATLPDAVTLSIVATTDLHGNLVPRDGRGGLAAFGGYVRNLRAARADDGGAVLLVDSGDTFQGGIDSDLSEGAVVVDAYAALGYTAAAIGNHEFDFGAADGTGARERVGRRSARRAQGARGARSVPVSRGELDRRRDREARRLAERACVDAHRRRRREGRASSAS